MPPTAALRMEARGSWSVHSPKSRWRGPVKDDLSSLTPPLPPSSDLGVDSTTLLTHLRRNTPPGLQHSLSLVALSPPRTVSRSPSPPPRARSASPSHGRRPPTAHHSEIPEPALTLEVGSTATSPALASTTPQPGPSNTSNGLGIFGARSEQVMKPTSAMPISTRAAASSGRVHGRGGRILGTQPNDVRTSHELFAQYRSRFAPRSDGVANRHGNVQRSPTSGGSSTLQDAPSVKGAAAQCRCWGSPDEAVPGGLLNDPGGRASAMHERLVAYTSLFPGKISHLPGESREPVARMEQQHRYKGYAAGVMKMSASKAGDATSRPPGEDSCTSTAAMAGHQVVSEYHRISEGVERLVQQAGVVG